ncbi:12131_t:CDS:2 [Funneliformis mosseae]|uniref:12131_t:CDS:1 n=1 Tax=Funneliformis mosseae TaxID=27381 RepID=A0A9N8VBR6_FUNMO|nr:12131_t:CDS:2 [Funneliformis mosseae]
MYLLWRWKIWPMINEFEYSKDNEIKRLHAIYQLQYPILHGKFTMMGQWLCIYLTFVIYDLKVIREGQVTTRAFYYFLVPLNSLFCLYALFMVRGVKKESTSLLCITYFGNILQTGFLVYFTTEYCYAETDSPPKICIKEDFFFHTLIYTCIMSGIFLILSTWNTLRCHRNFGRNLGFYINYEPCPKEFQYGKL